MKEEAKSQKPVQKNPDKTQNNKQLKTQAARASSKLEEVRVFICRRLYI